MGQPICSCQRLDQLSGCFYLLHGCISTQTSPTIVPPFLSLILKLKVLAKYPYFSPRVKKKNLTKEPNYVSRFVSAELQLFFAFVSKLENKPDTAARAAAAPGAACEAQALLTPLTVPRPAFPHPTPAGLKKQHHTDAQRAPGRTLPPHSHESRAHDSHGAWPASSMRGWKEQRMEDQFN